MTPVGSNMPKAVVEHQKINDLQPSVANPKPSSVVGCNKRSATRFAHTLLDRLFGAIERLAVIPKISFCKGN
jgi:hypothetical protein